MKKSEIYNCAMMAVIEDANLYPETKAEIIHELSAEYRFAKHCEEAEAKKKAEQEVENNG